MYEPLWRCERARVVCVECGVLAKAVLWTGVEQLRAQCVDMRCKAHMKWTVC